MKASAACALSVLALAGLAACTQSKVVAPTERGACFYVVPVGDQYRFDRIASNVPDLEHCAAEMEKMRLGLNRIGSVTGDITGSFQGRFLFRTGYGYYTSQTFEGNRYLLMVPYGGKLVMPGAVPQ